MRRETCHIHTLRIQSYLLSKCDWGIIYYILEGWVPSQTVFGSTGILVCIHVHIHVYIYIYTYTYSVYNLYIYIYIPKCTCMYIHIQHWLWYSWWVQVTTHKKCFFRCSIPRHLEKSALSKSSWSGFSWILGMTNWLGDWKSTTFWN